MFLLAAWVFVALNTAYHIGAHDFGWGFWLNAVLAVTLPFVGMYFAAKEDTRAR